MSKPKLYITVFQGCVVGVSSDNPDLFQGIDTYILDFDTFNDEGDDRLVRAVYAQGNDEPAMLDKVEVGKFPYTLTTTREG